MSRDAAQQVWFDARGLQRGFKTHVGRGIGTYVSSMVDALDAAAPPQALKMLVERHAALARSVPHARVLWAPGQPSGRGRLATALRQQVVLATWIARCGPAAVHFAAQTDAPAFVPRPTIITVHDVLLHLRDTAGELRELPVGRAAKRRFRIVRALERMAIERASRLVVPSRASAAELATTLGVSPGRIAVVPEAAGDRFREAPSELDVHLRAQLGLPARYLLHSGGADPRKRLPAIVATFDSVAREHADLGLVFVGPVQQGVAYGDLLRAIEGASARQRIVVLGLIEERAVAAVYRGAEALVLATSHEGFGLPVIEAFSAGVPVVATAAPAIAELAGEAARLVPVAEPELLRDALLEILRSPSLAAELRARGRRRAAQFCWPVAAEETLAVYSQVTGD